MNTNQNEKKRRNKYSAEFKQQAVKRAEKDGVRSTARDLGLAESQIYSWRQRQRLDAMTSEDQKLQHAELARLKRELARVEEENQFLKKATAYFAKQSR